MEKSSHVLEMNTTHIDIRPSEVFAAMYVPFGSIKYTCKTCGRVTVYPIQEDDTLGGLCIPCIKNALLAALEERKQTSGKAKGRSYSPN